MKISPNLTFDIISLLLQLAAKSSNALAVKGIIQPQVSNIISGVATLVLQEISQFEQPNQANANVVIPPSETITQI